MMKSRDQFCWPQFVYQEQQCNATVPHGFVASCNPLSLRQANVVGEPVKVLTPRVKPYVLHAQKRWKDKQTKLSLFQIVSSLSVVCVAQLAERRSLAGELTLATLGLQPTGDHCVGKPSATGQPTRRPAFRPSGVDK